VQFFLSIRKINVQINTYNRGENSTFRGSYLPELLAPIVPDGGSPPPGMLPVGRSPWAGPTEAVSAAAFASRTVLTLSLDAISANASLATPKFPDT
jgi:hypothetical protein